MQKIEGDGLAFVHSGGTLAKELRAGEVLKVDTGCIVGFTKDVDYDIEFIGGIKTPFSVEGSVLRHPSLEPFTYNLYLSADSLTECASAPKAGGKAAGKEAY
jgi:hypothetical protein